MARRHPSAQKEKGKSHIGDPHSKATNDRMKKESCVSPMKEEENKK